MRVQGKVAFVSGGARGLGAADVLLLSQEGAAVAFGDLLREEGEQLEASIRSQGGQALFVPLDVTDEVQWRESYCRHRGTVRAAGCLGQQRGSGRSGHH